MFDLLRFRVGYCRFMNGGQGLMAWRCRHLTVAAVAENFQGAKACVVHAEKRPPPQSDPDLAPLGACGDQEGSCPLVQFETKTAQDAVTQQSPVGSGEPGNQGIGEGYNRHFSKTKQRQNR